LIERHSGSAYTDQLDYFCSIVNQPTEKRLDKSCLEAKTLRVWDELKDSIGSWVTGYSRLDGTIIRMAASLGVRLQCWSEVGWYRGGDAWLNDGQQFAIIYQEKGKLGQASNRQNGKRNKRELLSTAEIK
jgi:hypothetical protein